MTYFPANIRLARLEKGLTQVDLSRAVGINQSYLSKLERGLAASPSKPVLRSLSIELDIDWPAFEQAIAEWRHSSTAAPTD